MEQTSEISDTQAEVLRTLRTLAETRFSYVPKTDVIAESPRLPRETEHHLTTLTCRGYLNLYFDDGDQKYSLTDDGLRVTA